MSAESVVTDLTSAVNVISSLPGQMMRAGAHDPARAIDERVYLAELVGLRSALASTATKVATDQLPLQAPAAPVSTAEGTPSAPRSWVWGRLTRAIRPAPAMTEAQWLDHMASVADATALVLLVVVPDGEPTSNTVARRRSEVAFALDAALGQVHTHPGTGRSLNVAIEVLVATSPLIRTGALQPAGILAKEDLPTVPIEDSDLWKRLCVPC